MRRCVITISVTRRVRFRVDDEEEETAEDAINLLEEGQPPVWLETLISESLAETPMEEVYIEDWQITGEGPQPDEELNFDE